MKGANMLRAQKSLGFTAALCGEYSRPYVLNDATLAYHGCSVTPKGTKFVVKETCILSNNGISALPYLSVYAAAIR